MPIRSNFAQVKTVLLSVHVPHFVMNKRIIKFHGISNSIELTLVARAQVQTIEVFGFPAIWLAVSQWANEANSGVCSFASNFFSYQVMRWVHFPLIIICSVKYLWRQFASMQESRYKLEDSVIHSLHKSHTALVLYPTMHHFVAEICLFLLTCAALWDICLMHRGICEMGLLPKWWH